jgi:hypothetical protein
MRKLDMIIKNKYLKRNQMRFLFYLFILSIFLTSCGDSDSKYISILNNNTDYEIVVLLSEDSTRVCQPNQETIIEEYWGGSVKEMSCMSPYIFKNKDSVVTVDEGNKFLTKDISDDKNWSCNGEEDWSLIMVGNYYSEIRRTFTVNDEDIKD